ncbi:Rab11 [Hexamita inflata]|uniref:Rab11 n=1 Tax=Hexamita inflata TaxID=28002 RepID=A0AA86UMN1_9EUKA|nr:Rab11 [Hexamita inflata]
MADEIKVVIIGDTGVGKTCIATRLIANTFNPQSPSTLSAAFLRKQMNNHQLQIWDTAGQERFRSIAPLYYRNAYAVILVFDITRKISFESLQFWLNDLSSKFQNQQKPLITFVGNKSDLQDQREVSVEQVEQLCQESSGKYFEVSAMSGSNVQEVFLDIISQFDERSLTRSVEKKKVILQQRDPKENKGCCFE